MKGVSEPSQRQLRVGEKFRHIIGETLRRGHFRDIRLLDKAAEVTVTEVRVSPDLRNATAYVLCLGAEDQVVADLIAALNEERQVFQKDINRHSNLKFTPRMYFKFDETFEEAQKIERLLREVHIPEE